MGLLLLEHSFIRNGDYRIGGFFEGWPCEGPLTQVFGKPSVTGITHAGDDIAVAMRTPLYAWAKGKVQNVVNPSFGKHVYLRHGIDDELQKDVNGIVGHCDQIDIVPNGKEVSPGELIAYSGNTGLSTGPHVHFGFGAYWISGSYLECWPAKMFIDRAAMEANVAMATYERGLLAVANGDPTTMSAVYDGLDKLGYFAAINATDDIAPPFLGESDPVKQLNAAVVRAKRITALACDVVNGPKAWEAVN